MKIHKVIRIVQLVCLSFFAHVSLADSLSDAPGSEPEFPVCEKPLSTSPVTNDAAQVQKMITKILKIKDPYKVTFTQDASASEKADVHPQITLVSDKGRLLLHLVVKIPSWVHQFRGIHEPDPHPDIDTIAPVGFCVTADNKHLMARVENSRATGNVALKEGKTFSISPISTNQIDIVDTSVRSAIPSTFNAGPRQSAGATQ